MTRFLMDASALYPLVKRVARDPSLLDGLLGKLVVLDLTLYESCNAAVIEHRRGLIRDPGRICRLVARLAETVEVVRVKPEWLPGILEVAVEKRLTFYDAAYVYTAALYNHILVTEDNDILRAYPGARRASEVIG